MREYGNDNTYFYIKQRPFSVTPEDLFFDLDTKKWVKPDKKNPPKKRIDKTYGCDRHKQIPERVFNFFLNLVINKMVDLNTQFKFPTTRDTRLYFEMKGKDYVLSHIKKEKALEGLDFIQSNFKYYKPVIAHTTSVRRKVKSIIITDSKARKRLINYQNNKVNYASSAKELTYNDLMPIVKEKFEHIDLKCLNHYIILGLTRLDGAIRRGCGFLSTKSFYILPYKSAFTHYNTLVSLRRYSRIPKESKYWYVGLELRTTEANPLKKFKRHHYNSIEAIKALRLTDYEVYKYPKKPDEINKLYKYNLIDEEIEPELIWKWSEDRPKPPIDA